MVNGQEFKVEVQGDKGRFTVEVNGEKHLLDLSPSRMNGFNSVLLDNLSLQVNCRKKKEGNYLLSIGHDVYEVMFREAMIEAAVSEGEATIKAPMPGLVAELNVKVGDKVIKDQPLLILEAMKMQNEIAAQRDGVVTEVLVNKGDVVGIDQKLLVVEGE